MFDYHLTAVAPLSHREPLAYLMAPRTVPTLVGRFTNPRPPVQNGTTPNEREDLGLTEGAALTRPCASEGTYNGGAANQEV